MKIAICDDDKKLRKDLRHLIEVQLDFMAFAYEIEEYESGNCILEHMDKNEPDILFLDIEMPGMGGMDTAKVLRKFDKKVLIIFVTAYPDYVFQGYEVHAFHYILKPYKKEKIKEVLESAVKVDGETIGQIGKGLVVLIGVGREDTKEIADKMVKKLVGMRIFEDENGKTNLSLADVDGSLLLISQFTLYANCKKGNRPSFIEAGDPKEARRLYEYIIDACKSHIPVVERGEFGADMKVSLINDGPFTIVLDSQDL